MAALTELVKTNALTDGSFKAACMIEVAPVTVCGMTSFGSAERLVTVATWAIADMPFTASLKAFLAARSGTETSSNLPSSA